MRFVYVMDPMDRILPDKDTTFAFLRAAQGRGHDALHCLPQDIYLKDGVALARVRKTTVSDAAPHFAHQGFEEVPLDQVDAVFIRKDPPFDVPYLYMTLLLERARGKTLIVNDPRGLRDANEKLYAAHFPEHMPRTLVTAHPDAIFAFAAEVGGRAVIKPLYGAGGAGVLLLTLTDKNARAIAELLTREGTHTVMVQEFLPAVVKGDKRVLLLDGALLGAINRVPQSEDFRSNIHVGGRVEACQVTADEQALIDAVGPRLRQDGLFFVGLDIIGGKLTEVNVTSPTGIQQLSAHEGRDVAVDVIAWVERRAAEVRRGGTPLTLVLREATAGAAGEAPSLTFDGPRIVIGRGAGCDVRLPDPSVSRRHATVRASGPDFALVDEGSSNGTFVGKERLSPHAPRVLKAGDLVRVGRLWLEARMDQTPATRDLATASRDLAIALVARGLRSSGIDPTLTVRVSSAPVKGKEAGPREPLRLEEEGRAYVVDDADDADLRFTRPAREPRARLQIVRRDTQVLVRALEGAGAIVLGAAPLSQDRDVVWRSPSALRIGSATLTLEEPAAVALADLETLPDEPVLEAEAPPPPAVAPTPAEVAAASAAEPSKRADAADSLATALAKPPPPGRTAWSTLDLAVLAAAVVVMGLSIAGVVWLLGG